MEDMTITVARAKFICVLDYTLIMLNCCLNIVHFVRYPACILCIVVCIYNHGPNGLLHERIN